MYTPWFSLVKSNNDRPYLDARFTLYSDNPTFAIRYCITYNTQNVYIKTVCGVKRLDNAQKSYAGIINVWVLR